MQGDSMTHPSSTIEGFKWQVPAHASPCVLSKDVFSCFVFELFIRVLAYLWIYGFPIEKDTFVLSLFPWQVLLRKTYKHEGLQDGLWEVSEKRRININQFMFKRVINDKLKLA